MFKGILYLPKWLVFIPAIFYLCQLSFTKPELLKRSDYLPPPVILKYLSAGLKVQLADTFWLRAVQDFDFCEQKINATECIGQSWLYQVIDLSVELDSQFRDAFFYGGLALTVLISDYKGASNIFDKGVAINPDDWELNYAAGYHAMVEEKNYEKAARRYLAAANHGAPNWVRVLAGRMAVEGGNKEFAEKVLQQMIDLSEDEKLVNRLKSKLADLKQK